MADLRQILEEHESLPFSMYQSGFLGDLAEAQMLLGNSQDAERVILAGISRSQQSRELWCMPELLRIAAVISAKQNSDQADDDLRAKLENARTIALAQGSLVWIDKVNRTSGDLLSGSYRALEPQKHILAIPAPKADWPV